MPKTKEEKKKPVKKAPNPKFRLGQKVIGESIKEDVKIVWPRELKVFYSLYEQYPSDAFWSAFELGFRLNSIAFLKTEDGAEMIRKKWKLFHFVQEEKEVVELSDKKFGEDKDIKIKPKSFKEFYSFV